VVKFSPHSILYTYYITTLEFVKGVTLQNLRLYWVK